MELIKCDINNLQEMKLKINQYNKEIIHELKTFDNELRDIPSILNTPKSSKVIPKCIEYFIAQENYLKNSTNNFNNIIDYTISEYSNYSDELNLMVGEKHD